LPKLALPAGAATLRRLLGNRNYGLYVLGHWTGNIGLWVQRLAIGWLTWELTHSFGWLGVIAFADQAPSILLGVIAGAVVDRVDYMKVLRATQLLTFLHSSTLAVLTLTGTMDVWLLLAMTLFRGTLTAFNRPSRMTVVYVLVGRDMLASALAFNSMVFNSSRFFGPAVGGAIMSAAGVGWTFAVAASAMLVFNVLLHIIRIGPMPARERKAESILVEAVEGVRYALTHAGISLQLSILVLVALFARPVTDLLPGFAAHVFERGPDGLALLLICHSVGAMSGGLWLTSRAGGIKGLTRVMMVTILFMAAVLLLFSLNTVFWIGCGLVGLMGLCFNIQAISNQTLIQYAVDPALRGRVVGLYGLIARGGPALGALIMGVAADHLGLSVPLGVGAAACLVLWLWAWRQRKAMAAALEAEPMAEPMPLSDSQRA
jgi:predicted MFS family arabinose efflux permease